MMKTKITSIIFLFSFIIIIFNSCKEDVLTVEIDHNKVFAETLLGTSAPSQPESTNGPVILSSNVIQVGNEVCSTKTVSWIEDFGDLVTLGGLDLFPGQVLTAESIVTGAYTTFTYGERAPICSATELPLSHPKLSYDASRSSYLIAINDHLNQKMTREVPIVADYSFEKVYAQDQLAVALGAHLKVGRWANISSSYNFNNTQTKTRVIIKLIQPFYKVRIVYEISS